MRVFGCVLDVKTVIHSRSLLSFGNSVPNPDGGSCFATPLTRGVGQCPRACAGTSRVEEQLHGVLRRWRVVSKTAPLLVLCRDRLASDTCVGLSDSKLGHFNDTVTHHNTLED